MAKKKQEESNLLPFLLGGVAAVAVGIGYKKYKESKEQTTDDISMFPGGGYAGIGGSGDFYGNSEPVSDGTIPVVNPMLYPDSMDAGIEDIARGDANLGITDVSDGGVNPTNYGTDGTDVFSDVTGTASVALLAGGAAASGVGYGLKAASNAATNAAQTASRTLVSKTTGSAATAAAGKVIQTAPGVLATAGKIASGIGSVAMKGSLATSGLQAIDWAINTFGIQDSIDKNGLTLPVAGFGPAAIMSNVGSQVMKNIIPTDKAASEAVGNVQTSAIPNGGRTGGAQSDDGSSKTTSHRH